MQEVHTRLLRLLLCVSCWLLLAAGAVAQEAPAVSGTVYDSTGGVLVGATVELRDASRRRTTMTDVRGRYSFADVKPGKYDLLVTYRGFAPDAQRIDVARQVTHDVVLNVLVTGEVTVRPEDDRRDEPILTSRVLSGEELDGLPSAPDALRRYLWELAGATGRPGDLVMYVDGFPQTAPFPPTGAIQMIRINSNPFAAEFEEPGRNRIEITTQPGFDEYRGEIRFRFNDGALNARHAFAPRSAIVQSRTYTGYLGGPIVPQRWSVLFYGGRWEENASAVVHATVLDPATLQAAPLSGEVLTPRTIDNLWLGTEYRLGRDHTLALSASRTREEARNQGLDGGLDLPERGYTRSEQESLVRAAVTSTPHQRFINELHVEASRRTSQRQSQSDAPAVMVLDAFTGGGNQAALFDATRADGLRVVDHVTTAFGRSLFKAGVVAAPSRERHVDRRDFGGTFVFGADVERDAGGAPLRDNGSGAGIVDPLEAYRRTLLALPGYGPSQFWIVRGDPRVSVSDWWGAWFVQADWTPAAGLAVSYGVRQEFQDAIRRGANLAPRVGVAWTPDNANTVRVGSGIFYDRIPADVLLDVRRFGGEGRERLIIRDPSFFPGVPADLPEADVRTPAIHVLEAGLTVPRSLLASVSYERRWRQRLSVSAGYSYERGSHLLRRRNINAPANGRVPFPGRGAVLQYESSAQSERHEVLVAVRTSWTQAVRAFANYTWGPSLSDTDGPSTAPADSYDLAGELAPIRTDARHRVRAGLTLRLPGRVTVSGVGAIASGRPFDITTGRDDNGDTLFTDRPAFAAPEDPDAIVTPFGRFDPTPAAGGVTVPRNYGRGPAEVRIDLHVARGFRVGPGGTTLRVSADVVNLLNRVNVTGINGVVTSPAFGTPTRARDARRVDVSIGVTF
jgi:hypothetical protein